MKNGLIVDADGTRRWVVAGKLHREDGPAVEYTNGTKYWYINGKLHRTDGPAIIWHDGTAQWFVNNNRCKSTFDFQYATDLSDEQMTVLILKYGNIS